jgi:uncharacterized tellurite resistance protein B-like protein
MSMTDRIFPLSELLLGAAYADKELKDEEKEEVRKLLQGLAGDLSPEVDAAIASFEPAKFDVTKSASAFKSDSEEDRKKLLYLVAAVNEADDELDFAEDDYLRALATALELPTSALEGLTMEVETEELKETFEKVVRKGPPPPPPPKAKSVDVDMD